MLSVTYYDFLALFGHWTFPEVGKYLLKMTVMSRYLRIMLHATLTLGCEDGTGWNVPLSAWRMRKWNYQEALAQFSTSPV